MVLVDTSAWIEFDRGTDSPVALKLRGLVDEGSSIASTEPVLMEMLGGTRGDRAAHEVRRLLTSFEWISADATADFEGAARIYRACRAVGVEPGGYVDCMIAAIALRTDAEILTTDSGFERIAEVFPLRLMQVDSGT
ncbi:MAG: PIN domain nuclease [Actinomycetota bacterium]